jgi:hypothetical protein
VCQAGGFDSLTLARVRVLLEGKASRRDAFPVLALHVAWFGLNDKADKNATAPCEQARRFACPIAASLLPAKWKNRARNALRVQHGCLLARQKERAPCQQYKEPFQNKRTPDRYFFFLPASS